STDPGATRAPAGVSSLQERAGSRSANVHRATGSPDTTQGDFATSVPRARAESGTVQSVVTSPEPTSSASSSASRRSRIACGGVIRRGGYPSRAAVFRLGDGLRGGLHALETLAEQIAQRPLLLRIERRHPGRRLAQAREELLAELGAPGGRLEQAHA